MGEGSLFGSEEDDDDENGKDPSTALSSAASLPDCPVATYDIPPISGLHLFRALLPLTTQDALVRAVLTAQAVSFEQPQAMFFPRSSDRSDIYACPDFLVSFVEELPEILSGLLSEEDHETVFDQSKAMQTIVNLYEPGKGISPHVDLPHRYAEPIVGISLLSRTVMHFESIDASGQTHEIVLEPGDVYILLGQARYGYKHGIAYRDFDLVQDSKGEHRKVQRGSRLSITFRRMKESSTLLDQPAAAGQSSEQPG